MKDICQGFTPKWSPDLVLFLSSPTKRFRISSLCF